MSTQTQYVRDILNAIDSVKARVRNAMITGDFREVSKLMLDLQSLEVCLVTQTSCLLSDLEKQAA